LFAVPSFLARASAAAVAYAYASLFIVEGWRLPVVMRAQARS